MIVLNRRDWALAAKLFIGGLPVAIVAGFLAAQAERAPGTAVPFNPRPSTAPTSSAATLEDPAPLLTALPAPDPPATDRSTSLAAPPPATSMGETPATSPAPGLPGLTAEVPPPTVRSAPPPAATPSTTTAPTPSTTTSESPTSPGDSTT